MPSVHQDPMRSPYTTTITDEALRRGIGMRVIDASVPVFELFLGKRTIRCYRSLTDRTGAVTFYLAQHKFRAGCFLRERGFPVPEQHLFTGTARARAFLERYAPVVVKPCSQWGARGVSTGIVSGHDLQRALRRARRFEADVMLEHMVPGDDHRLVFIDYRFVCALQRRPACVTGSGGRTIRELIRAHNSRATGIDPANKIPLDRETVRFLSDTGWSLDSTPHAGQSVVVRRTANYNTGGSVHDISDTVDAGLVDMGRRIVEAARLPVAGIDVLRTADGRHTHVIELAPDLAISPRGGAVIAERFIDYLFPETARPGQASSRNR